MTSVKLSADSVDEEKKSRRCFLKESSILSKRIVGAKRENRRCSWEVSQYTLRSHLTAMYREVIIRDKNIVKS